MKNFSRFLNRFLSVLKIYKKRTGDVILHLLNENQFLVSRCAVDFYMISAIADLYINLQIKTSVPGVFKPPTLNYKTNPHIH